MITESAATAKLRSLSIAIQTLGPEALGKGRTIELPPFDPNAPGAPVKTYDTMSWRVASALQNLMPQDVPARTGGSVSTPVTNPTAEQLAMYERIGGGEQKMRATVQFYTEASRNTPSMNNWPPGVAVLDKLMGQVDNYLAYGYSFETGRRSDGRWMSSYDTSGQELMAHFEADVKSLTSAVRSVASLTGDVVIKNADGTYKWGVFEIRDRTTGELYANHTSEGRLRYYDDGKIFVDGFTGGGGRMKF